MTQEEVTEQVKEVIQEDVWGNIKKFLDFEISLGSDKDPIVFTVGLLLFVILVRQFS